MSNKSNRKQPVGRRIVTTRMVKQGLCEKAFSVVELMTVITIIGVLMTSGVIVWEVAARGMDVQSAGEMFKEDVRKVESMTTLAGGGVVDSSGIRHRDQYCLEIYTSTSTTGANSYAILTRQWSGNDWSPTWTPVTGLQAFEANRIVNGNIKPSNDPNVKIDVQGSSSKAYDLIFEAKGSIVHVMEPTQGKAEAAGDTVVRLGDSGKHVDVTISIYGDISGT